MTEDIAQQFQAVTEEVLRQLGIEATVTVTSAASRGLRAEISSADSALLIGWRGQTLAALEYLVRVLMMHQAAAGQSLPELHIDAGQYRQRQQDELVEAAHKAAETVRRTGSPEILRPMNAFERRVVHVALSDMSDLATESIGAEPSRRIIIKPK